MSILYERLERLEGDSVLQNLISQANSRYILYNTKEPISNFPHYTITDEKLNLLAFQYIDLGCHFFKEEGDEKASFCLEKGASLLEYVHGAPRDDDSILKGLYGLISSLAYYASFQYSKSFILMRKIENNTEISKLISLFLKRDINMLSQEVGEILIKESERRKKKEGYIDDELVYTVTLARVFNSIINYIFEGNLASLEDAKNNILVLKEILEIKKEPDLWWVIRLLLLILKGIERASLWQSLRGKFDVQNDVVKKYIKGLAYNSKGPIYELFISQRGSLDKLINGGKGCVINLPTSSGKTRIAELAILDCIINNPNGKILYLAPFRSLSFEIENILEETFGNLGVAVSHLYGGQVYNKLDRDAIESSQIIIATPEKSKAILRGNSDIFSQIKLVIIDEGHLLGAEKRHVVNEMFYEELRYFIELNQGRIVLLSAVLPNSEELALWVSQDKNQVYKNDWRPSEQRLGVIQWKGKQTDIKWIATIKAQESYNKKFILNSVKGTKNSAVAEVAHRFNDFGSVLVFVGQRRSVFTIAEAYVKCAKNNLEFKYKDESNWKLFELACIEALGEDNKWLEYARKGILCHNADLVSSVRVPLEKLMRTEAVKLIVATSTLAQGVNLGISTVIFSTLVQGGSPLSASSFWNIAGRAGRAFVDYEGKILIAQDLISREHWQVRKDNEAIESYIQQSNVERAESGILIMIRTLYDFSQKNGISFDNLISLISDQAPNHDSSDKEIQKIVSNMVDWIDDSLLSLHLVHNENEEINYAWIDNYFRKTLAHIQAEKLSEEAGGNVVKFFKLRAKSIVEKIGSDRAVWRSFVNAGVPINCNLEIEAIKSELILLLQSYLTLPEADRNIIVLIKSIEGVLSHISHVNHESLDSVDRDLIREQWISGVALQAISQLKNAEYIVNKYYGMDLPWILNAITRKLELDGLMEESELLGDISSFIEYGLFDVIAIKIYQAGIRSRVSALELSLFFIGNKEKNISWFRKELIERDFSNLSDATNQWLDIFKNLAISKVKTKSSVKDFILPEIFFGAIVSDKLFAKQVDEKQYLHSLDYDVVIEILNTENLDFSEISNVKGVYFAYDQYFSNWVMHNENPNIQIKLELE